MHIKPELIENTEICFDVIHNKCDTLNALIGGNDKINDFVKKIEKCQSDYHYLLTCFTDYAGLVESLSLLFTKIISLPQSSLKQLIPHLAKLLKDLSDYQSKLFIPDEEHQEKEDGDCETKE